MGYEPPLVGEGRHAGLPLPHSQDVVQVVRQRAHVRVSHEVDLPDALCRKQRRDQGRGGV